MIDAYVKDTQEKDRLFHAVDNFESVQKKADWALKWLSRYYLLSGMNVPADLPSLSGAGME